MHLYLLGLALKQPCEPVQVILAQGIPRFVWRLSGPSFVMLGTPLRLVGAGLTGELVCSVSVSDGSTVHAICLCFSFYVFLRVCWFWVKLSVPVQVNDSSPK